MRRGSSGLRQDFFKFLELEYLNLLSSELTDLFYLTWTNSSSENLMTQDIGSEN